MRMKVAIIGAGLVGRLLAWRLNELQHNIQITLIDQHDRDFFGTGLIAAAMVAPFTEAVSTEAITQTVGLCSYSLWQQWLADLERQTGHEVSFTRKGTLVVSHPQDEPDWQRFYLKAQHTVPQNAYQTLNKQAMQGLEPQLGERFTNGLFFANEGVIDNLALYPALNDYFSQAAHIQWRENTNIAKLSEDGTLSEINESYDLIFDCRGNGARDDLSQLRSVRGEVARVHAPEVTIQRAIRLIHPRFPLYIAPRKNHEYIIGATQIESDADTPVTVRSGLELLSALYSLHPGFSEAHIIQLISGLRPTFKNNLPRIEFKHKLISINGLYRHGYLFSPALINDVLTHVLNLPETIKFPQFHFDNTYQKAS